MTLEADQDAELKELNAKIYYFHATQISLDVAGIDLDMKIVKVRFSLSC